MGKNDEKTSPKSGEKPTSRSPKLPSTPACDDEPSPVVKPKKPCKDDDIPPLDLDNSAPGPAGKSFGPEDHSGPDREKKAPGAILPTVTRPTPPVQEKLKDTTAEVPRAPPETAALGKRGKETRRRTRFHRAMPVRPSCSPTPRPFSSPRPEGNHDQPGQWLLGGRTRRHDARCARGKTGSVGPCDPGCSDRSEDRALRVRK